MAATTWENKNDPIKPNILELFLVFLKIGAFTIGGGYAMLPLFQQEFIYKKKWMDSHEFLDILVVTQSLPGPLIINFALLAGYRLKGIKGGFFSLLGTIIPSFLIILFIAKYLWHFGDNQVVQAVFGGIRPVIVALILAAAIRLGKNIIQKKGTFLLVLIFLFILIIFNIHPIFIVAIGILVGLSRLRYQKN